MNACLLVMFCPCTHPHDEKLEWTRTDKLTEVRNFISALTECTGDGAFICITSGKMALRHSLYGEHLELLLRS